MLWDKFESDLLGLVIPLLDLIAVSGIQGAHLSF